jgi:hypothetical protein
MFAGDHETHLRCPACGKEEIRKLVSCASTFNGGFGGLCSGITSSRFSWANWKDPSGRLGRKRPVDGKQCRRWHTGDPPREELWSQHEKTRLPSGEELSGTIRSGIRRCEMDIRQAEGLLMKPERTMTNGIEETAHDAVSAPGAIFNQQGAEKLGLMKRFLKWLSRGADQNRASGTTCPTWRLKR